MIPYTDIHIADKYSKASIILDVCYFSMLLNFHVDFHTMALSGKQYVGNKPIVKQFYVNPLQLNSRIMKTPDYFEFYSV